MRQTASSCHVAPSHQILIDLHTKTEIPMRTIFWPVIFYHAEEGQRPAADPFYTATSTRCAFPPCSCARRVSSPTASCPMLLWYACASRSPCPDCFIPIDRSGLRCSITSGTHAVFMRPCHPSRSSVSPRCGRSANPRTKPSVSVSHRVRVCTSLQLPWFSNWLAAHKFNTSPSSIVMPATSEADGPCWHLRQGLLLCVRYFDHFDYLTTSTRPRVLLHGSDGWTQRLHPRILKTDSSAPETRGSKTPNV